MRIVSASEGSGMRTGATATAYLAWDERWKTPDGRRDWLEPEQEVKEIAGLVRDLGSSTALDLGCGVGRHSFLLESLGFKVLAVDRSSAGIVFAQSSARRMNCSIHFVNSSMTELPCEDQSFDYVLAWKVIYHGNREVVEQTLSEIHRVLRPGGVFQGTMLSKNDQLYGRGRKIAPDTFVTEEETDKVHPHFYCNQLDLATMLDPMELLRVNEYEHDRPGSRHLHFVARKSLPDYPTLAK